MCNWTWSLGLEEFFSGSQTLLKALFMAILVLVHYPHYPQREFTFICKVWSARPHQFAMGQKGHDYLILSAKGKCIEIAKNAIIPEQKRS